MTAAQDSGAAETRSVVMERDMPFPPEKIWRALTTPHLLEEWLMKTTFRPELGHVFQFSGDWGSVDCKILEMEPPNTISYSWDGMGLESTVTWTLTPSGAGTHLRMEQAGFRQDQERAYQGAKWGWNQFFGNLEGVLAKLG